MHYTNKQNNTKADDQACSLLKSQQYLYPCWADGLVETVQWDGRFGCSLWTTRRGVKTATHAHTDADADADTVVTIHRSTQFNGMPSKLMPSSGKHHQQPLQKKRQRLRVAESTVTQIYKNRQKRNVYKWSRALRNDSSIITWRLKTITFALNSEERLGGLQNLTQMRRSSLKNWRGGACVWWLFEANGLKTCISLDQPLVPAPTSTSYGDFMACREKHNIRIGQHRGLLWDPQQSTILKNTQCVTLTERHPCAHAE